MAAKAGQLDLGGARIFTLSPCFNAPNSKHRKVHWTWGKVSNFREKFLRTGKEKGDPSTMLGLEELEAAAQSEPSQDISILQWSCVCFYCCRRHCLRQGGAEGGLGHILGTVFGGEGNLSAQATSERTVELGSVSWVAFQLRVMNQSSRRKQPERRGCMRKRSESEGLMTEIRQPVRGLRAVTAG